jgi:hypothetical protein
VGVLEQAVGAVERAVSQIEGVPESLIEIVTLQRHLLLSDVS